MSTLQARLEQAMRPGKVKQTDLAKACGISTAAVAKWFGGTAKNLKMEHLFAVADLCQVDARWLATGKGAMTRGKGELEAHQDIPQRRIDLIRMYGRLPDEVRQPIRALIETLAYMEHPRKFKYAKHEVRKAESNYFGGASRKAAGSVHRAHQAR